MENIRSANSETNVRHVLDCETFDSREPAVEPSFYRSTSERNNGLAADGCYFNAVFNDSSETFVDDEDTIGRAIATPTSGTTPATVSDPSTMVRLTVASSLASDGSQPFRRSHSMRSSFNSLRSLRTRLKQSTTTTTVSGAVSAQSHARNVYCHLPTVGDLARSPAAAITKRTSSSRTVNGSHFSRSTGEDMRSSLRHKLHKLKITYNELRRLQTKVLQEKHTLDESSELPETTILPENIPPKAAALLMEGFTRANVTQSSLKVHRRPPEGNTTVTVTRSSSVRVQERPPPVRTPGQREQPAPSVKLTVVRRQQQQNQEVEPPSPDTPVLEVIGGKVYQPPTPVPSDDVEEVNRPADQQLPSLGQRHQQQQPTLTVTRTATIRKGSVWANNSTKISLPELVTRSLSNIELPSCRVPCPSLIPRPGRTSPTSPGRKSTTSSSGSLSTIETQTVTASAQSLPITVASTVSLTYEDELSRSPGGRKAKNSPLGSLLAAVASPVLSRISSASSPNLSSCSSSTSGNRMEYLLPHQQHPPGAGAGSGAPQQQQQQQSVILPKHRQHSPKIIKKTRHLSTSSVEEAADACELKGAKGRHPGGTGSTEAERNARNAQHLLLRSNRLTVSDNHNLSSSGGGGITTTGNATNSVDVLAVHNAKSVSPLPSYQQQQQQPHTGAAVGPPPSYWKQKKLPNKKQHKQLQAQLDKLTQINIHLHALFSAVEHGHLEKARTILESTDVDVNSLNSDGLTPLDVAVLSNNRSMTKMLLQQGAIENAHSVHAANSNMGLHLNNLLCDAEATVHELGNFDGSQAAMTGNERTGPGAAGKTTFSNIIGSSGPSVTSCTGSEIDKQVGLWERRVKGLRRMILGWEQTKPPDVPNRIDIDVTGCSAVSLRLYEPLEGAITTKFKVQWSSRSDFSNVVGEREISEWCSFHGCMGAVCNLNELIQGRRYFFRACAGNVKGWGPYKLSVPNCVVPSSWRDVENRDNRFAGKQRNLDELFNAVRLARPEDASEIALDGGQQQKRATKKKTTIKQLFSAASKFQKNLKRGIYLACVLYHEDKLLLTNEDFVPVIEIDETFTSNLHTDFYWLMKVACTWDDVKLLRMDMERNASSAIHFRTKLLSAACQMQSALSITDLGQLFYRPLRDVHGTVVLSCVNCIKSPKAVSVLNSRWIPLNKIHKKLALSTEDSSINEILMNSIQEQINYHQVSNIRLSRGLYVGYLKMQSSVDVIQVVVPVKAPNVLPHCKIRDNPHVSAEEWELIKQHKPSSILEFRPKHQGPTEVQLHFLELLTKAVHNLFQYMDIPVEVAVAHRLYDVEVIELNADVSFLIICPPAESSCAVPGQKESLLQRGDLFSMPIQAFEMIHLKTYQSNIIQKYSRLSCILELDTMLANHLHREAFSTSELQKAKDRLAKLQELSGGLNTIWKGVRWLMDVIGYARDRANMPELNMKQILDYKSTYFGKLPKGGDKKKGGSETQLLHPPGTAPGTNSFHKSSPGRGSWPGPAVENTLGHNGLLDAEHSKSEQLLKYNSARFLNVSQAGSRKNSADSNSVATHSSYYSVTGVEPEKEFVGMPRLPPSRSEDTLNSSHHHHHHHGGGEGKMVGAGGASVAGAGGKKRPPTIYSSYSATSSPLLNVRSPFLVPMVPVTAQLPVEDVENSSKQQQQPSNTASTGQTTLTTPTGAVPFKLLAKKSRDQALKAINFIEREQQQEMEIFEETKPILTTTYLKPTLTALQNEAKTTYQPEPDSIPASTTSSATQEPLAPTSASSSVAITVEQSATSTSTTTTEQSEPAAGSTEPPADGGTTATSILQVYAAYETGLPSGTSLKLRVTPRTSAREVIDLVVKQLNMAVVLKGREGPIYTPERLDNFCLVAVIGARERCLRDDFRPLQLQNPWRKGRLYVRQKHDLLAAIEHSNRDTADI
uniref:Ras-associating domain-containing protein n=1 Tax=Anopheles dirus TaxID=7168 RepID=A0A182NRS9_9DIPT